jgi:hypothetical protein
MTEQPSEFTTPLEIILPNNSMAIEGAEPLNKRINEMRKYHKFLPRFIIALSISNSVAEACQRVRHATMWWQKLSPEVQQQAIELADELFSDPILQAREMISNGVMEAAQTQMKLVHSKDERVAGRASTYVLDKVLGKAATSSSKHIEVDVNFDLPFAHKPG